MSRLERLLQSSLRRRADENIGSADPCALMQYPGFEERIRASHHLYRKEGVAEHVKLKCDYGDARPHQMR